MCFVPWWQIDADSAEWRSGYRPDLLPDLITGAFHTGLVVVFGAAAVMMLIGAVASVFNPGRYADESTR